MKKGIFFLILGMAFFSFPLSAQDPKPLIHLKPLLVQGIGAEESRLIESLVRSYLSDFGEVISSTETQIPNYILTGSVYLERDSFIFMLEISKTVTGEDVFFTMTSKSVGELVLKARSLVEITFVAESEGATQESRPLDLKEAVVLGTWREEPGIRMIRLQRMGQGLAIFSSGVPMALAWVIEDNILKIRQVSPNTERYYHPLPYGVAKQLAADAAPIVWELQLYDNGNTLRGLKILTGVHYEGEVVTKLIPKEMQNIEWTRSGR